MVNIVTLQFWPPTYVQKLKWYGLALYNYKITQVNTKKRALKGYLWKLEEDRSHMLWLNVEVSQAI